MALLLCINMNEIPELHLKDTNLFKKYISTVTMITDKNTE